MSGSAIRTDEVRVGDRLRTTSGEELTVSRIDEGFLGRSDMLAFVEDSDTRWLKMAAPRAGEVELVCRPAHGSPPGQA